MASVQWSRDAYILESIYDIPAGYNGYLLPCYLLKISSRKQVTPYQVLTALQHLRRKVPCLRLVYDGPDGQPNTCIRMTDNDNIDFKVEEGDVNRVVKNIKSYRYNRKGPLWCARLMYDRDYPMSQMIGDSIQIDLSTDDDSQASPGYEYPHITLDDIIQYRNFGRIPAGFQDPNQPQGQGNVPQLDLQVVNQAPNNEGPCHVHYTSSEPRANPLPILPFPALIPASAPGTVGRSGRRRHPAGSHNDIPMPPLCSLVEIKGTSQETPDTNHPFLLLLGIHIGIADGISAAKICGLLIRLIDDVLNKKVIDDNEQLGDLEDENVITRIEAIMQNIKASPDLCEELKEELDDRRWTTSSIDSVFKGDENGLDIPRKIIFNLDSNIMERFLAKCKSEKVKLHSAFCAIVDLVLMDIAMANDVSDVDNYVINSTHAVNLRRFWVNGDPDRALGCWAAPMHLINNTPISGLKFYWNYASQIQAKLTKTLEGNEILKQIAFMWSYTPAFDEFLRQLLCREDRQTDYTTMNLGDITPLIENNDMSGELRLDNIEISISQHKTNSAINFILYTFKGQLYVTLDYNKRFLTNADALGIAHKIKGFISNSLNL